MRGERKNAKDCKVKRRFRSIQEAKHAIRRIWHGKGNELYFYECELCKGFHLTKKRR